MNLFDTVKDNVTALAAAESYGLKVSHNGMCVCPFHEDHHPSMKVDKKRYHCFGCQADGDVIDFTARLFDLSAKEAALKLAGDFGLSFDKAHFVSIKPVKREPSEAERSTAEANHCFSVLADYRNMLAEWQTSYAPDTETDMWHPRFIEANQKLAITEYLLDQLLSGTLDEKKQIVAEQAQRLPVLEKRVQSYQDSKRSSILSDLSQPCRSAAVKTKSIHKEASLWNL